MDLPATRRKDIGSLSLDRRRLASPAAARTDAPPGRPVVNPYDQFTENSSIKLIEAAGAGANIRFDRTVAYETRASGQYTVVQNFLVTPKNSSSRRKNRRSADRRDADVGSVGDGYLASTGVVRPETSKTRSNGFELPHAGIGCFSDDRVFPHATRPIRFSYLSVTSSQRPWAAEAGGPVVRVP